MCIRPGVLRFISRHRAIIGTDLHATTAEAITVITVGTTITVPGTTIVPAIALVVRAIAPAVPEVLTTSTAQVAVQVTVVDTTVVAVAAKALRITRV